MIYYPLMFLSYSLFICSAVEVESRCEGDTYTCKDGTIVSRIQPDCGFAPCRVLEKAESYCNDDTQACPDGTSVSRVKPDCEFPLCAGVVCTIGSKLCDDGSVITPGPPPDCTFPLCPEDSRVQEILCTTDTKKCDDGETVVARIAPSCDFELCPRVVCPTDDDKLCADGSVVKRGPPPDCAFPLCPEDSRVQLLCDTDTKTCGDGETTVARVEPSCDFALCPEEVLEKEESICTEEAKECLDGTVVFRVKPDCEFQLCPGDGSVIKLTPEDSLVQEVVCEPDTKKCDDGETVVARVAPSCDFALCPTEVEKVLSQREYVNADTGTENVLCGTDTQTCRDGTTVGRVAPSCAFALCPEVYVIPAKVGYMNSVDYNMLDVYNWQFCLLNALVSLITCLFVIALGLIGYILLKKCKRNKYEFLEKEDIEDRV